MDGIETGSTPESVQPPAPDVKGATPSPTSGNDENPISDQTRDFSNGLRTYEQRAIDRFRKAGYTPQFNKRGALDLEATISYQVEQALLKHQPADDRELPQNELYAKQLKSLQARFEESEAKRAAAESANLKSHIDAELRSAFAQFNFATKPAGGTTAEDAITLFKASHDVRMEAGKLVAYDRDSEAIYFDEKTAAPASISTLVARFLPERDYLLAPTSRTNSGHSDAIPSGARVVTQEQFDTMTISPEDLAAKKIIIRG